MTRRAIELLLLVLLGALWGLVKSSSGLTVVGALGGAAVWSLWDGLRARHGWRRVPRDAASRQRQRGKACRKAQRPSVRAGGH